MNTLGKIFRVSIFGESHSSVVGVLIDGCPPGIILNEDMLLMDISRRKSGAKGTSKRTESDIPEIMSGVFEGKTTGAPIMLVTKNKNIKSADYDKFKAMPRPGHADMVSRIKYNACADQRGGGHLSGRLSWGLVVAGSVAKEILRPATINASLISAGGNPDIEKEIRQAIEEKDSIGGLIECRVNNLPAGYGEPWFYSLEAAVSQAVFSIPAIKGLEFGSGFAAAGMKGSKHNDPIIDANGSTMSNNAGGVNGGISNGNELLIRVAVKPASSISKEQTTFNLDTNSMDSLEIEGRHDTCIALRMPVVIESALAVVLADLSMINKAIYSVR